MEALVSRVSPDGKSGLVMATYHTTGWEGFPPLFDFSFTGHGMGMLTAPTVSELATKVAELSPAALRLRRREELLKELRKLEAADLEAADLEAQRVDDKADVECLVQNTAQRDADIEGGIDRE